MKEFFFSKITTGILQYYKQYSRNVLEDPS